jgi:thioredoxin-related protein
VNFFLPALLLGLAPLQGPTTHYRPYGGFVYEIEQRAKVSWRSNYDAVCKEAKDSQKPILLLFCTSNCFYCDKLELMVLGDPDIAGIVNNRFVPLKVAGKDSWLVEALKVVSYPTLVLATADGKMKILKRFDGCPEPAELLSKLEEVAK